MSTKVDLKTKQVLEYLKSYVSKNGFPPSVREICTALKFSSTNAVYIYLKKLEHDGLIKKSASKNRAIEIIDKLQSEVIGFKKIPLVGTIAAGTPILATENIDEYFTMPDNLFSQEKLFMLTVKGDSMINVGIMNGDKIIIKEQNTAENGQIVAALIDDSATVKRFFKENGHYRLQPENDNMQPIIVESVEILGILVGLVRKY